MWLIADLDRPRQGIVNINQQPLIEVLTMMDVEAP
jgi:hypothetical protein